MMADQEQEQEQEAFNTEFKLLLIGDEGVGKKEFIARFGVTPEETTRPQVVLHTYRGPLKFNIWDSNVERDVSEASQSSEVDIRHSNAFLTALWMIYLIFCLSNAHLL